MIYNRYIYLADRRDVLIYIYTSHIPARLHIIEKIVKPAPLSHHCAGETAVGARAIAPSYRVMRKYAEECTFAPITAAVSHVRPIIDAVLSAITRRIRAPTHTWYAASSGKMLK